MILFYQITLNTSSRPKVFCKKKRSKEFCKIHKKIPVPEYLF